MNKRPLSPPVLMRKWSNSSSSTSGDRPSFSSAPPPINATIQRPVACRVTAPQSSTLMTPTARRGAASPMRLASPMRMGSPSSRPNTPSNQKPAWNSSRPNTPLRGASAAGGINSSNRSSTPLRSSTPTRATTTPSRNDNNHRPHTPMNTNITKRLAPTPPPPICPPPLTCSTSECGFTYGKTIPTPKGGPSPRGRLHHNSSSIRRPHPHCRTPSPPFGPPITPTSSNPSSILLQANRSFAVTSATPIRSSGAASPSSFFFTRSCASPSYMEATKSSSSKSRPPSPLTVRHHRPVASTTMTAPAAAVARSNRDENRDPASQRKVSNKNKASTWLETQQRLAEVKRRKLLHGGAAVIVGGEGAAGRPPIKQKIRENSFKQHEQQHPSLMVQQDDFMMDTAAASLGSLTLDDRQSNHAVPSTTEEGGDFVSTEEDIMRVLERDRLSYEEAHRFQLTETWEEQR